MADVPELLDAIASSAAALGRFLWWAAGEVPTSGELAAQVRRRDADFDSGVGFEFVMRESPSRALVGEAGADLRRERIVEIGYWVRSDRTGQGYASPAAAALTTTAFACFPEIERVELRMDKGNARSAAVARRLGFSLLGEERFEAEPIGDQTGEGYIWGIDRAAWPSG